MFGPWEKWLSRKTVKNHVKTPESPLNPQKTAMNDYEF
jgi:hypothetical protein